MRRAPQAAAFYPGELSSQANRFLEGFRIPGDVPRRLFGGVVPHAGWRYSGQIAARTLHTLVVRCRPQTIIFFATAHVAGVDQPSVYPEGVWETPVGDVEVNARLARDLINRLDGMLVAAPWAHDRDHAIEVELPLVRLLAPGATVVPIAMPPTPNAARLGERLGAALRDEPNAVVVASTDLTHYGGSYGFQPAGLGPTGEAWLRQNDARILAKIKNLEADEVVPEALSHRNACGPGGLAVALASARARGSRSGHVIEYTTSHEMAVTPGPFTAAVGYAGAVF